MLALVRLGRNAQASANQPHQRRMTNLSIPTAASRTQRHAAGKPCSASRTPSPALPSAPSAKTNEETAQNPQSKRLPTNQSRHRHMQRLNDSHHAAARAEAVACSRNTDLFAWVPSSQTRKAKTPGSWTGFLFSRFTSFTVSFQPWLFERSFPLFPPLPGWQGGRWATPAKWA